MAIGQVIRDQSFHFLVDPKSEEAQRFFLSLAPPAIEKSMNDPNRSYFVAEDSGAVVGVIMVRDKGYISQFFVAHSHQRRGIGRLLWNLAFKEAVAAGGSGEFAVDSSLLAQPVYAQLGFLPVGKPTVRNGFEFVSMRRASAGAVSTQTLGRTARPRDDCTD